MRALRSPRFAFPLVLAVLFVGSVFPLVACSGEDDPPPGSGSGVGTAGKAGGAGSSLDVGGRAGAGGDAAGQGGVGGSAPTGPDYQGTAETTTPFYGSTGGNPTATPGIRCAEGEVLVGLRYRQDPAGSYEGSIVQLRAICAELEDVATAVTTKPATTVADVLGGRSAGFPDVETRCAENQAVTQMQVLRKSATFGYPYELLLTCGTFGPPTATLTLTGQVPAETKTSQAGTIDAGTATCQVGQIATGLDGLTGSEVDRIGLYCETMIQSP